MIQVFISGSDDRRLRSISRELHISKSRSFCSTGLLLVFCGHFFRGRRDNEQLKRMGKDDDDDDIVSSGSETESESEEDEETG